MSSYATFENLLQGADAVWTVDLSALNSSGVNATAVLAMGELNGSMQLGVSISASGLTPDQTHVQHIHGRFDEGGAPIDSVSPTLADDADLDGLVEVLEGVARYGDVLLPLVSPEGGAMPVVGADGTLSFVQTYDLGDASNFFSPVTMTDYTAADLMPLELREIVLHGVQVPDGIGAGTGGEVDGGENGYIPILPAASGEIEVSTMAEAMALIAEHRLDATDRVFLGAGDDAYDAGPGDDFVDGQGGDDSVAGGADNDTLTSGAGRDAIDGGTGDDLVDAGTLDTNQADAADAGASGGLTLADYDNGLAGGAGNDFIRGRAGDDIITGDDDSRVSEAVGTVFDATADGMDTIFGGAGNDEIHTGSWSDADQGLPNAQTGMMDDIAYGGSGDDILRGAGGDDLLQGDAGADDIGGAGGDDTIHGDGDFNADPTEVTGALYRLYQAAFDRDPDIGGFEGWAAQLGTGALTVGGIAAGFAGSAEFAATYGGLSDADYVTALYANVLDRDPDDAGLQGWLDRLDSGATRAEVLVGFSQSTEFRTDTASDVGTWVAAQGTHDVVAGNGGANLLSGGVLADRFVFATDAGSSHDVTDLESWDMLDFTGFGYGSDADARANMMQSGDDVVFADMDVTVILRATDLGSVSDDMILI